MARTKWSLLKATHVSPDPSTKYGEEVEEGTPTKVVHIRNNLVIFPKEDDGKTVPICTKFKCRWAHLAGEGIWGVFYEKVGLMMDSPGMVAGKSNMSWKKTQAATREGWVGEPGGQRLSHSFS